MKKTFVFIFSFLIFNFLPSPARAEFNPNYIVSDSDILDYSSMTLGEVREFISNKGGYIKNYAPVDQSGKPIAAADIIYDRAVTNKVSQKFLLVLLQKEQSLVEDKEPTQGQLDWATGYGCLDGTPCNTRWQGFWKQVNSASLQFRDYMDNPGDYKYQPGKSYAFNNPYSTTVKETVTVTPANRATAALYNYTPHVYNGNYNFYNIWQRYFTRSYLDGSLLQAEGEAGVWLIQNGKKRPFLSRGALLSRFNANKIIIVSKADLDKYPTGTAIKFPQYSLVRSPRGTIFLLIDDKRRGFASSQAFKTAGINPEEVIDASWEDINSYEESAPITATSSYAFGALLQDKATGGVYWVENDKKSPLLDKILLSTKFKGKKITPVTPEELKKYETAGAVKFNDGEILKSSISPAVYIIANGRKHPVSSAEVFTALGYKWENLITVSPKILYLYEEGEPLTKENSNL